MAIKKLGLPPDPGEEFDQYDALFPPLGAPNPNPLTTNPTPIAAGPAPTPPSPFATAPQPTPPAAAPPPPTGGNVEGIDQLPDGMGGVVNVPPPGMAPPEPLGLSPIPVAPPEPALPPAFVPASPIDAGGASIPQQPFIPPAAPITEPAPTAPFVPPYDPGSITPRIETLPPVTELAPPPPLQAPATATPHPVAPTVPPLSATPELFGEPEIPEYGQPTAPPAAPTVPVAPAAPAPPAVPVTPLVDVTPPAVIPPPPAPPETAPRTVPETRAPEVAPIADVQPVTELPTFSPEENIIDTAILPSENLEAEEMERQAQALLQGDVATMTGQAPPIEPPDAVLPEADARVLKLQGYSDAAIEKIMGGPDRYAIAEEKWRDWLAKTAPDYEQVIRGATEEGAAHGRLGSGILTNRYGDIATTRARDMDLTGKEFMRDALEGSVDDRERALAMIRDVLGQEQGEGRAVRGERRAERETGYARRAGARDELRGAAADRVQRDAQTRDEFRGERDFQRSSASEAIARRIMQREMENSEQQQGFNNAITLMEQGAQGNPSEAEMAASAQAAAEAAGYTGDIAELIRFFMLNRTLGGANAKAGA